MSGTDDIVIDGELPRIVDVKASDVEVGTADRFRIMVTWSGSRKPQRIDVAADVFTFKIYAPLRSDRRLFERVDVVDDGHAIAWGDDHRISMPATAIERLGAEVMTAYDLRALMGELHLTKDGLAAQLGVSRRLVGYWLEGQTIPRYIVLACRSLAREAASAAE